MNIIYQTKLGQVAVIFPANNSLTLDQLAAKDVPADTPWLLVDSFPDNRLRDAWKIDFKSKSIVIDMDKAKNIIQQRIRVKRKPILEALDIEYMRATETGNLATQQSVAQQKQKLRDATEHPSIINAKTPEELLSADPFL